MEFQNNIPIYLQVIEDIKSRILSGEIHPGDKLPSSREMAVRYGVNPNTASRIYNEMERQGITFTKRGIGTFVTESDEDLAELRKTEVRKLTEKYVSDLTKLGLKGCEIRSEIKQYFLENECGEK